MPTARNPPRAIASAGFRAAADLRLAAAAAGLVLVDTPGRAEALGGMIRDRADLVVIPCQPAMPDVMATGATLEIARAGRAPHVIVLNRVPPRGRAAQAAAEALAGLGAPVAAARLGQRSALAEAFARGLGAGEMAGAAGSGAARAAAEIAALAEELAALMPR
ncbi:MAG: hypothetical protein KatS3mg118_3181 [Paracoccaceae bacterium]|nr:MAG: hypothetical protein KatS3mg118_3181 [Paracoccaceae bacterium]